MNYKRLRTLYKKEIMDVIRDKKTILMMVVLPVLLYPVLFLLIMQVMTMIMSEQEERTYYIAYQDVDSSYSSALNEWIAGEEDKLEYVIKEVDSDNPKQDLEHEKIDAYLTAEVTDSQVIFEVHYLNAVTNSASVASMLEEEIKSYSQKQAENYAMDLGLDVKKVLYPVEAKLTDQSSNESSMGSILGSVIPFLLITSILMGSMYPAIDATAGEKERGTLETLLTLPVSNMELIMSKFLSVATISIVSVFINILSMGGIAIYLYATISSLSDGAASLNLASFVPAILISVVCVIAFALFMSAVVMCICAFAKSFKEANNYVSPLSVVVLLISYIGFIPNVELTPTTAMIPVANICLLIKNLLIFKYDYQLILIVLLSNVVYAFVSVWFLGKVYNSESILFGEAFGGMKLFERRKNIKKGSLPSVQESLLILVIALLLMVYVGGIMSLSNPIMGVVIPQTFIGVLPILACIYIKADMKKVFALKLPKIKHLAGTCFLGAGAICLTMVISNLLSMLFPGDSQGLTEEYMQMLDGISFVPALILIALTPAVCEELMYRGYMFTAFKQKMSLSKVILIVSLLFAASHMSLIKIIPTCLLGMVLAYVVEKSGSIVTSSLIHFMNNGLAVVVLYYGDKIPFLSEEQYTMPIMIGMLIVSIICIPIGLLLMKNVKCDNK